MDERTIVGDIAQDSAPHRDLRDSVYASLVAAMDQAFCLIEVLFDSDAPHARAIDYRYLEINPAYAKQSALRDIIGRTAREVTPNVEQHWIDAYGRVVRTGAPARIEAQSAASGGRWFHVEAFRVGDPALHHVAVLFTDVTTARTAVAERDRLLAETEAARAAADVEHRRLLAVLEQLPVGVHVAEAPSGRLVLDNAAIREICGEGPRSTQLADYSRDYSGHWPPGHARAGERLASDAWPLARALVTGMPIPSEYVEIRRADGSQRLASISAAPMHDRDGRLLGAVATSVDVTEAESLKAQLAVERERLRTVVLQVPAPIGLVEKSSPSDELRFTLVNDAFKRISGGGRDVTGLTPREAFPELSGSGIHELFDQVCSSGQPWEQRETHVRLDRDGTGVIDTWFNLRFDPVRDSAGVVVGVFTFSVDVTDEVLARREVERLLAESEASRAQATAVLESIGDAFYAVDADFRFTYVNRHAEALWGRRREEMLGRDVWSEFPLSVGSETYRQHLTVMRERRPAHFEMLSPVVGRWLDVSLYPDSAGGVACYFRDITPRKRAEAERERLFSEAQSARAEAEAARERTVRLQSLTAALAAASTPDEVAAAAVRHTAAAFGATGIVFVRCSSDGESLEIVRALDMPEDVRDGWQRFPLRAPGPLADAARTGRSIYLESRDAWESRYPHLLNMVEATSHQAHAVMPLVFDGRVLGVLGAAFSSPRVFDEEDRALGLAIAQQCAQALERAWLFEAEREARREAEGANRAKSEFLAVMSHELRTPLNAIGGYAELMEMGIRGPVTPQQREDLRRVQHSQRHLLGLINEVLNYAKLETGTVHYSMADLRVRHALTAAETLVAPQAAAKGLVLTVVDCPPTLIVRADEEKLQQILVNLLSNAVKFTDRGGEVVLSCTASGDEVHMEVRDTGIGIAADQLERIFDPFVQVRSDLTRTAEGTGLGLAISRDLAWGMGGNLTVDSSPGVGSVFRLTLPGG